MGLSDIMAELRLKKAFDSGYVYTDGVNKSKYAVVIGLECKDPSKLKVMTLKEARIKACRLAKANKGERIGIFKEDKYHISAYRYMPKLVEDVDCDSYHSSSDDYLLCQWSTHRLYRVSAKTGKLLDINRYFRYI